MDGNLLEWMEDCWKGDCGFRVLRGGSWHSVPELRRAADRDGHHAGDRHYLLGFRVARTLD